MPSSRFPVLRGPDVQQSRVQDNVQGVLGPVAQALQATPIMGAAPPPWIAPSLLNGWTYLRARPGVGYHKDALGYCHLNVQVENITGAPIAGGTTIFVLPVGYRPYTPYSFAVSAHNTCEPVDIAIDGAVSAANNIPNNAHVHVCVNFLAER